MPKSLTPVPRVESQAPNKNTIEWRIPDKVTAVLMLIDKVGYTFIIDVIQEKKHWWNRSRKSFHVNAADSASAVLSSLNFLEKYGYTIDHNSIELGERIGDPDYFEGGNKK